MYTDRSTQEWIDVIHRAQDTFEKIIGKRAVGYVATSSDFQMDAPPDLARATGVSLFQLHGGG